MISIIEKIRDWYFNPYSKTKWGLLPLLLDEKKIMLSLSPKSGSLFGVSWFFYQANLWQDVKEHPKWAHHYRQEVYYKSPGYPASYRHFFASPETYTKIKLVRNPYCRAVSSYIHALRTPEILYRDTRNKFTATEFSFETFLAEVEKLGTRSCDVHYRTQTHEFERNSNWDYQHIVQLESAFKDIPKLEKIYDLKTSPLENFRESEHNSRRKKSGKNYVGSTVFSSGYIKHSPYPYFYNTELAQKVQELYAEDFRNFGYSTAIDLPHATN